MVMRTLIAAPGLRAGRVATWRSDEAPADTTCRPMPTPNQESEVCRSRILSMTDLIRLDLARRRLRVRTAIAARSVFPPRDTELSVRRGSSRQAQPPAERRLTADAPPAPCRSALPHHTVGTPWRT